MVSRCKGELPAFGVTPSGNKVLTQSSTNFGLEVVQDFITRGSSCPHRTTSFHGERSSAAKNLSHARCDWWIVLGYCH